MSVMASINNNLQFDFSLGETARVLSAISACQWRFIVEGDWADCKACA